MTEDDVRQRVVGEWLRGHGFGPADVDLEFSFEIRWGRATGLVGEGPPSVSRPRADCVVRTTDGLNLMVIEVKAPNVPLGGEAREQGISYARLLREGGIAPFVVLTNGKDAAIYDTVTEERLDGHWIPLDHPAVTAGYRVSVDDLALRAEALEALVSLTPENLTRFCANQVAERMRPLADPDPARGFKYVPTLYVSRVEVESEVNRLLKDSAVVLLHGPPQVGKTNVLCHLAAARVAAGRPTLFYSAAGIVRGLVNAVAEDFEWTFGDATSPVSLVRSKLGAVLRRTGQNLVVFVDGWNEAVPDLARVIDADGGRLADGNIRVVVSATETAVERLLLDGADNPSCVAGAIGLSAQDVHALAAFPDRPRREWADRSRHGVQQ